MRDITSARTAHMQSADPFVKITEDLDEALDLMRVAYLAMNSPDRDQVFERDVIRDVVIRAIYRAEDVFHFANSRVAEIWKEAEGL